MAWIMIVSGLVLIALGTLAALKVRAHMWGDTRTAWQLLVNFDRPTFSHWIHEYDQPDKWLLGLGLFLRFPAAIVVLWGLAGLVWTS